MLKTPEGDRAHEAQLPDDLRPVLSRSGFDTICKKSTPHSALKILYQFHHGDAQTFETHAATLRGAIGKFTELHPKAAIYEILLTGRHGRWVPVSPDVLGGGSMSTPSQKNSGSDGSRNKKLTVRTS